ncbi:uncharacterized protein [Procambarus clarkii]|uniref:uncharacterized protein n=1 Tax=Procambarus clarkii TaxID=6728 RepID=UPI001E672FCA|nr:uncharacterized protein LOC123760067 [Procambarus clarkii]
MEEAEMGCCVCQERYDEGRPPRNLGCGHSVCTQCVQEIINRNRKCPECRRPFYATMAVALPINYPLLRLSRTLAALSLQQGAQAGPSTSSSQSASVTDAGECGAHVSRMGERCMTCNVWVCKECLVMDHVVPPDGNCHILPVSLALEEMKKTHMENISTMYLTLQGLKNEVANQISQLENNKSLHDDTLSSLREILQGELDVIQEVEAKKKEATDKMSEVDCWVESLKESEACIVQAATVRELASAKLAARVCLANVNDHIQQERERQAIFNRTMPQFGPQNLRGVLQMAKRMYVVQESEGERRWARVSVHDCLLHLHVLQHQPPPPPALIFSYWSVRSLVPQDSPSAFLDLGWGGHTHGRVYLRMLGDTARAQQFLYLCSGEKGPSYFKTRLFDVDRVGEKGEIIRGGDYENNNGTGGAAIVEGVFSGEVYLREAVAGLLVGAHERQTQRLGVFGIILSAWPHKKTDTGFGQVTSGLGTLRSAARHKPITDVTVENCGLVIPL